MRDKEMWQAHVASVAQAAQHASYCALSMDPKATECDCQPQEVPAEQRDEHGQIQTFEERWARFYCKVHFVNDPNDTPTRWAKVPTHDFDEFAEHVKRHLRSLVAERRHSRK
jgi:hypothetical protein